MCSLEDAIDRVWLSEDNSTMGSSALYICPAGFEFKVSNICSREITLDCLILFQPGVATVTTDHGSGVPVECLVAVDPETEKRENRFPESLCTGEGHTGNLKCYDISRKLIA